MSEISVVIPAYNSRNTIREALNSLSEQTFRDFETIVVDDGSNDGTADLVEREFPDVQVMRQDNTGPASARNKGAQRSRRQWLAFLDADDSWLPWRLQVQMDLAREHPGVAMWCGETVALNGGSTEDAARGGETGMRSHLPEACAAATAKRSDQWATAVSEDCPDFNGQQSHISKPLSPDAPGTGNPLIPLPLSGFAYLNPVATSTVLLKKTVFEQCGGFDSQFRGPEDYDLWIRVAAIARVAKIAAPLSRYRGDPGSLSMDDRRFLPEVLRLLDKAYGPTGALKDVGHIKKAQAVQYVHASWMAYRRGARGAALAHLASSLMKWPMPLPKARWKYLMRYLLRPSDG